MFSQRIRAIGLLLIALAATSACDRPTDVPVVASPSFAAQITGGANHTVRGRARFSADAVGDAYGFAIMLFEPVADETPDRVRHAIYLYRAQPGGPNAGEFRVIESRDMSGARATDFVGGIVIDADAPNGLVCQADSGTVRLTPRADGRLLGTFAISARCERMDGPGTDDPIEVTGSFEAEVGVVALPEVGSPSIGAYALSDVDGQSLPGVVSFGVDEGHWFEVVATSGRIAINAAGHYEQSVMLEARTDGQLTGRWRHVDRGACRPGFGLQLICTSEYIQNVTFGALVSGSMVEVWQDITGEGGMVRFRYRRADSP